MAFVRRRIGISVKAASIHNGELPLDYQISPEYRLLRSRAWGVLTHPEITAHRLRFTSDPAFQPDFDQLYDLREVTSIAATVEQIREISSHSPFSSKSRRAIVATRDAVYGMARMFALQHETTGLEEIRVFRSIEEAQEWLGLNADSPESEAASAQPPIKPQDTAGQGMDHR